MTPRQWLDTAERVTYPTGYTVDVATLQDKRGRVKIRVERFVGGPTMLGDKPGDYSVDGSVIPRGATGLICHETLPIRTFRASHWRTPGAVLVAALDYANRLFAAALRVA